MMSVDVSRNWEKTSHARDSFMSSVSCLMSVRTLPVSPISRVEWRCIGLCCLNCISYTAPYGRMILDGKLITGSRRFPAKIQLSQKSVWDYSRSWHLNTKRWSVPGVLHRIRGCNADAIYPSARGWVLKNVFSNHLKINQILKLFYVCIYVGHVPSGMWKISVFIQHFLFVR